MRRTIPIPKVDWDAGVLALAVRHPEPLSCSGIRVFDSSGLVAEALQATALHGGREEASEDDIAQARDEQVDHAVEVFS